MKPTVPVFLLLPLLFACQKPYEIVVPAPIPKVAIIDSTQTTPPQPEEPEVPEEPQIPEDAILVTNPYMEAYLEEVHYPEGDFSYSKILSYPGGGPGEADIPPSVTLSWPEAPSEPMTLHLDEGEWSRDYSLSSGATSLSVTNLVPNQRYIYDVTTSSGVEVARDTFYTKGHMHQIYFTTKVRNARDLGGWKTYDGRTVSYRKLYRGGKPSDNYINSAGRKEALAVGIKAELCLRTDCESEKKNPPFGKDIDLFGPGFENGYSTMLKEGDKVKQCFEFVVKCLREDKPVYFHCSIGSDRTGTMAILLLGALGVPEPDVCKDYELSYFAPEAWSMTNGVCNRVRTYKNRYLDAINYLLKFGKGNFRDHVENYLLSIGVAQKDIEEFRSLMLKQ